MKKLILLLIFILPVFSLAQNIKSIYVFTAPILNDKENIQFKEGHKIKIIDIKNDTIFFTYFKFIGGNNPEKLNTTYYYKQKSDSNSEAISINNENNGNSDLNEIRVYGLEKSKFNNFTTQYYSRFKGVKAGVFTVPFKIRTNDFDFEQNVNIGMNLGFPVRLNRYLENNWILIPTVGIGLSTINLNPKNSDLQESDGEDANRTASAFSISGGFLLQFSESINIGLLYGFDFLGNNDKSIRWKYDRKPWIGIGINVGVSLSKTKDSKTKNRPK